MKPVPLSDIPEKYHAQIAYQLGHAQFHPSLAAGLCNAVTEQTSKLSSLGKDKDEKGGGGRYKVRIIRHGAKLLDPDNLAGAKLAIDQLRYAGLIPEDNPHAIELELCQVKTPKKEDRGTLIEITRLP